MCMNKVLAALSSAVLPLTGRLVIGKIDADQRSMRSNDRIDLYLMTTLLPCEYESVDTPEHSSETAKHARSVPHVQYTLYRKVWTRQNEVDAREGDSE